ncbi:MAG: hypothetical protein GF311_11620 [Candidatus Lokiarchaeota archaeon]|nr:hypothetical protein [Candidatus Lokiarchaeota archaeon]
MLKTFKFKVCFITESITRFSENCSPFKKIDHIGSAEASVSIKLKKIELIFQFYILSANKEFLAVLPTYLRDSNLVVIEDEGCSINVDSVLNETKKADINKNRIIILDEYEEPNILIKKAVLSCLVRYKLVKPSQFENWIEKVSI